MCLSSICVVHYILIYVCHYILIYVCGLNSVLCPIQRGVKAWESAFDILKSKGCLLDRWMGQLFQYSSIHIHFTPSLLNYLYKQQAMSLIYVLTILHCYRNPGRSKRIRNPHLAPVEKIIKISKPIIYSEDTNTQDRLN